MHRHQKAPRTAIVCDERTAVGENKPREDMPHRLHYVWQVEEHAPLRQICLKCSCEECPRLPPSSMMMSRVDKS